MAETRDPKIYLVGAVAILAEYRPQVMEALANPRTGTRVLKDYPSLRDLRAACEALNAPFEREAERLAAHESHLLAPPPRQPRTPEQQRRVDAQVEDAKRRLQPPSGRLGRITPWRPLPPTPTGERHRRLMAELEARKARNEALRTGSTGGQP